MLLSLAALAGATLAGFAGAWWWLFDLCSHFRPQYAIAAAALALMLLALKHRRAAAIAVLVMATNLAPIVPMYLPQTAQASTPPTVGGALRVMSVNVFKSNRQYDRMLDHIRRENPDVLILLEVTRRWVKPLERLNRKYPFRWVRPGEGFAGIAVYSRFVPVESRVFDLAGMGMASFLVTVETGDAENPRRLSVLGAHLKSPTGALDTWQRNRQLEELGRIAREHPWPLLLMGDLNVTSFSPLFGRMVRASGLKPCAGQTIQPTWPAYFPPLFIRIDHCLATPALRTWDFRVGPDVGSDHFPISVKVQPGPP